jgi:hypothetical protein
MPSRFLKCEAASWSEAVGLGKRLRGWVFRGHADPSWQLKTTLERQAESTETERSELPDRERQVIDRFRRQALQFLATAPEPAAYLEWLSIIQHHGGPTRLLDFTRSFYVAAFFALDGDTGDSVVWAVNKPSLDDAFLDAADLHAEAATEAAIRTQKARSADSFIGASVSTRDSDPRNNDAGSLDDRPHVLSVEAERLTQRMVSQQSVFLMPTMLHATFMESLERAFGEKQLNWRSCSVADCKAGVAKLRSLRTGPAVVKIILPKATRRKALEDLQRMNINAASLFPGIDGFARSLGSVFLSEPYAD